MSIQTHPIIARGFLARAVAVASLLSLASAWAADKAGFRVRAVTDYPARQGEKKLTAAVKPFCG